MIKQIMLLFINLLLRNYPTNEIHMERKELLGNEVLKPWDMQVDANGNNPKAI